MRSNTFDMVILSKVLDRILVVFRKLAIIALWLMALLLMYDVVVRYVFNTTSEWSMDVVQLVQVAMAFLAAGPVLRDGGHINMEALTALSSKGVRRRLIRLSNVLCFFGSIWMAALSWRTFTRSYEISEAAFAIAMPLYPWKFLVPLCFFLLGLQFLHAAVRNQETARRETE